MLVRDEQLEKAPSAIKATVAPFKVLGRITDPDEELPSIKYAEFPEALIMYFMELVSSEKESPVPSKAVSSIDLIPSGMVMLVRDEQLEKARPPIDVTLSGMVMLVRDEQLEKAPLPIEVTLLGMVTLAKLVQLLKTSDPIEVTLLGMVTLFRLVQ